MTTSAGLNAGLIVVLLLLSHPDKAARSPLLIVVSRYAQVNNGDSPGRVICSKSGSGASSVSKI
jgi:hypothetical protein